MADQIADILTGGVASGDPTAIVTGGLVEGGGGTGGGASNGGGFGGSMQIVKGSTEGLQFLMLDASKNPVTGITPTVVLLKKGQTAFASPSGGAVVQELSRGWYQLVPTAGDTDTFGSLILEASGVGAVLDRRQFQVVAYDPENPLTLGLAALQALALSTVAYGTLAPLPIIGEPDFSFNPAYNQAMAIQASSNNLLGIGLSVSVPSASSPPDATAFAIEIGLDTLIPGTSQASGNITWHDGIWVQPRICVLETGPGAVLLTANQRYRVYARLKNRVPSHTQQVFDFRAY